MFNRLRQLLAPPETKASRTARLVAFESGGRARWTPRDYTGLAREGYLANAIVHRSVRLIAENAAACQFLVFEGAAERDGHPLAQLLTRPNPRQDGAALFETLYAHLLLAGNGYLEQVALNDRVRELYALRPDRMKVVPGADGWAEAYEYSVGGRSVRFDQHASAVLPILHLTFFHPLDDHYGLAPVEAAAIAVDAAIQISVLDISRTSPPVSPAAGERHVVASGATGAWAGHVNAIASWQDGAWAFLTPHTGWCIWSVADDVMFVFDGTHWRDLRNLTVDNLPRLGVNTTSASPNLLSVKSNAALLAAINVANGGTGDVRWQISKESAAKTASVLLSDAFSGRAEIGLAGDDNLHLKVSPDGSSWSDALVIDRTTGKITLLGFSSASTTRTQLSAAPVEALSYSGMQVNGAMEVAQENGSSAVTLTATGTLQFKYLLDGVMAGFRGTFVAAGQQVTAPSGMPAAKALKITVTTAQASLGANDELSILLPVEGTRTSRLLSGTSLASAQSLGFWFSAHRTGTYSGAIMNGARTRSYPFAFTVSAADTPQWVSLSGASAIAADTAGTWANDNTLGMVVSICLAGGSSRLGTAGAWAATTSPGLAGASGSSNGVGATSDVFYLSNVIALAGIELPPPDRVPLIMRPFDQELGLCQRYFRSSWDYGTAPGTTWTAGFDQMKFSHPIGDFSTTQIFPAMRSAGTLTIYDAVGNTAKVSYYDNSLGSWANNGFLNTQLAKQGAMFVQHTVPNSRFTNFGFRIDARL